MKNLLVVTFFVMVSLLLTTGCPPPDGNGGGRGGFDTIPIPKTGQDAGDHLAAGDDGDLQTGAAWPNPRFPTMVTVRLPIILPV
jgi:hypothetical protein